jgi:hypothetical protein
MGGSRIVDRFQRGVRRSQTLWLASLAIAAAGGIGGYIYVEADRVAGGYQQEAAQKAEEYAKRSIVVVQARCVLLPLQDQNKCLRDEVEAAREGQRKEYDLQAQRETATWTRAMGVAALVAMFFGIVGVGLVYLTFSAQRRGNRIALREYARARLEARNSARDADAALKIAERNAETAAAQVTVAQEANANAAKAAREQLAQLRPYLSIDNVIAAMEVNLRDTENDGYWASIEISFAIENSGQSMARNVRIWIECSPMNLGSKTADWQLENMDFVYAAHIAPNSTYRHSQGTGCAVDKDQSRNPLYFSLCIAYETDFIDGVRQTCEEYVSYKSLFGNIVEMYDLSYVEPLLDPVPLLMRRSRMFSRMT